VATRRAARRAPRRAGRRTPAGRAPAARRRAARRATGRAAGGSARRAPARRAARYGAVGAAAVIALVARGLGVVVRVARARRVVGRWGRIDAVVARRHAGARSRGVAPGRGITGRARRCSVPGRRAELVEPADRGASRHQEGDKDQGHARAVRTCARTAGGSPHHATTISRRDARVRTAAHPRERPRGSRRSCPTLRPRRRAARCKKSRLSRCGSSRSRCRGS